MCKIWKSPIFEIYPAINSGDYNDKKYRRILGWLDFGPNYGQSKFRPVFLFFRLKKPRHFLRKSGKFR